MISSYYIFAQDNNSTNSTTCIKLQKVVLQKSSNHNILSKYTQKKLLKKYHNRCINQTLIQNILKTISNYYTQNGYITTKAYLKPQNINDGIVDISITVGIIKDIINTNTNKTNTKITTAFIFQKDRPLNLRNLETSLEMMNKIPSTKATFKIVPGDKIGHSIIKLDETLTNPFHLNIGSSGGKITKDNNPDLTVTLSIDNLFYINDIFSYKQNGSKIQDKYQATRAKEYIYTFSLGSYSYTITKSYTYSRTYLQSNFEDKQLLESHGRGTNIELSKILNRDQKNKLQTSLAIYKKDPKSQASGVQTGTNIYKTTLLNTSLTYTNLKTWGSITNTYTLHKAMPWFNAHSKEIPTNDEKYLFTKHTLDSTINYSFLDKYTLNTKIHIQKSQDKLYSNDKITTGGSSSVRGHSVSYSTDSAYYIKNDISRSFDIKSKHINNISLKMGLDYGRAFCDEYRQSSCGELYGSNLDISINSKYLNSNFGFSKPLKKTISNTPKNTIFSYSISKEF